MIRRFLSKRLFSAAEAAVKPYVFVNKYTKVICQGMTGKEVCFYDNSIGHFPHKESIGIRNSNGGRSFP
jgi:succinyl-CoA synthetase alpha subunit